MRARYAVFKLLGLCVLGGVLLAGVLFPFVGAIGLASNRAGETVDALSADLVAAEPPLVTTITDMHGTPIAYLYDQYRVLTPPEMIADTMRAAIIAVEDRRFYEHHGVDWFGTMRAFVTNQIQGEIAQGGSTLTQQYVKNYLYHVVAKTPLEQARVREQTPARKLRELRIAMQLETRLSKDEILTRYLNTVPFGHQTYGIAAAAQVFFNTTPDKLTIAQSALLAGIVNRPGELSPVSNPEGALQRRNFVIDKMVETGSITPEMGEAAKQEPLGVVQPLNRPPNGCVGAGPAHGFFCRYVVDYLQRAGFSMDELRRGGYVIRTTLDPRITDAAKQAAEHHVPKTTKGIANVMAVVEPGRDKHKVRALVANRDFGLDADKGETSYPLPSGVTPFGAGSIYKIFTAAAALEKGMGINNRIDVPGVYVSRTYKNGNAPYTVRNAGNYPGSMTLQDALATSPNTAFVALQERIGLDAVVDMAARLGMRQSMLEVNHGGAPLAPDGSNGPSQAQFIKERNIGAFTLGFTPTGVLELANVSATLISGGVWCPPTPIESITDHNGQPVAITEAPCEQVVDEGLANSLAVGLSKDHLPGGTAYHAAQTAGKGWTRPMLGKTGTTQNHQSAGFTGATPQYAGAVLTFSDGVAPQGICDTDPPRLCGSGGNIYGGKIPARTWFETMVAVHEGLPVLPLPEPDPRYVDGSSQVQVPNVVGMRENEAKAVLERAGYKVDRRSVNSEQPRGVVASQSPRGVVLPGETVTIWVSTGYVPPPQPSETEQQEPATGGEGQTPAEPPDEGPPPTSAPSPEPGDDWLQPPIPGVPGGPGNGGPIILPPEGPN
ncbi:MAG TPA: penicillin-binding protein [Pseudonocardiaceae bacterium]